MRGQPKERQRSAEGSIPGDRFVLLLAGCACTEIPTAATGERVQINGMQTYYEVSGEGEPLVVLHGAYMNIPSMGAIIPKLAETHKVYAVQFQGHGRTTDIDRPITYANLADDVAAFMDAGNLEAEAARRCTRAGEPRTSAGAPEPRTVRRSVKPVVRRNWDLPLYYY